MPQPFSIDRSESRVFKSTILDRDFNLFIHLPDDYGEKDSYPILYALDGHVTFQVLTTICGCLAADGFIPKIIIVGISSFDYARMRMKDFTPTPVTNRPESGGAADFLSSLKQELIPFVESNYKADIQNRVLLGHSLSGLFCLYTLFQDVTLFNRYISTSASLFWDDGIMFQYESALAEQTKNLPVDLFLSVGEQETSRMVESMRKFAQAMYNRDYEGFKMTSMVIAGERHLSTIPEAFNRGLRAVFARKSITLDYSLLVSYTGKYRLEDPKFGEVIFTITCDGDQLYAEDSYEKGVRIELLAETNNHFWFSTRAMEITFNMGDKGIVTSATIHEPSGSGDSWSCPRLTDSG